MNQRGGFLGTVRLATRPAAGASGVGQAWWEHHIQATRQYLESALSKSEDSALGAVARLWNGVLTWQDITASPVAGVLMAEHTALAKLLVDSLAAEDEEASHVAADALMANVQLSKRIFPRYPDTYAGLLEEHVRMTGLYATALAKGDVAGFEQAYAQAVENGRALGAFTDRSFGTTVTPI